ncbi:MAG: tetratricopeptide (TPR) repeat protein [Cognaticolwellia sp.]|jgi:tetratricopeptide (TPR) repeat protein
MWILMAAIASAAPEVAVLGLHIPGQSADEGRAGSARIVESLNASGAMVPVGPDEVALRLQGRSSLVLDYFALSEGEALLDEGQALYQNAEPDAAIPLLEQGVEALAEGARVSGNTGALIEGYLTLGLAQSGMGNNSAALQAFSAAVVLDPKRELDTMSYPPDVIELYTQAQSSVLAQGTGTLNLKGVGNSTVKVDGIEIDGDSAEGLAPGTHYVYATDQGGARYAAVTQVSPGETATVTLSFGSLSFAEPTQDQDLRMAQTEHLYSALGAYAQTPLILLGGQVGDEVVVALYSARSKNFSQALSAPAGTDPTQAILNLVPAIGSYVTEAGDIRPDRVAFDVPAFVPNDNTLLLELLLNPQVVGPNGPVSETGPRWGLWAGVGGVAALGAGAATWAVLRDPEPKDQGTVTLGPIP